PRYGARPLRAPPHPQSPSPIAPPSPGRGGATVRKRSSRFGHRPRGAPRRARARRGRRPGRRGTPRGDRGPAAGLPWEAGRRPGLKWTSRRSHNRSWSAPGRLWEVSAQLFDDPLPRAVEVRLDLRQAPSGDLGDLAIAALFESAQLESPAVRLAQAREHALQLLVEGVPGGLLLGGGCLRRHVEERIVLLSRRGARQGDDQLRTPPPVDPEVVGGAQQIG